VTDLSQVKGAGVNKGAASVINPSHEENKLLQRLGEANQKIDRAMMVEVKNELVQLYLTHGEHFKMNENPDPIQAEYYLKKALNHQKDHPVVNYRLAHLLYRKEKYAEAIRYFQYAIDGSRYEALNDTQMKLARMFMVNCGIYVAKEALEELQELEEAEGVFIDKNLIEKYQSEILAGSVESLDRMFYQCQFETGRPEIISETTYLSLFEPPYGNLVILGKNDEGYFLYFQGQRYNQLDKSKFLFVYLILTSKVGITNQEIQEKLLNEYQLDINEDNIRQTHSRLNRRIPFLENIIEESRNDERRVTRRLKSSLSYCIVHRSDDDLKA
jgi:tetratricopeptide (TPR) repeat protein